MEAVWRIFVSFIEMIRLKLIFVNNLIVVTPRKNELKFKKQIHR